MASSPDLYFEQAAPRVLTRNELHNLPYKKAWRPAGFSRPDFGSGPPPTLGALVPPQQTQTASGGGLQAAAQIRHRDEHDLMKADLRKAEMDRLAAHKRMAQELVSANQMLHQASERQYSAHAGARLQYTFQHARVFDAPQSPISLSLALSSHRPLLLTAPSHPHILTSSHHHISCLRFGSRRARRHTQAPRRRQRPAGHSACGAGSLPCAACCDAWRP